MTQQRGPTPIKEGVVGRSKCPQTQVNLRLSLGVRHLARTEGFLITKQKKGFGRRQHPESACKR